MRDSVIYTNHYGEKIVFGEGKILINENDLRDYEWSYSSDFGKISNFTRAITKKKLPVVICCDTREESLKVRNRIYEILEKDIIDKIKGTMEIGDYKSECYIISSKKSDYTQNNISCNLTLTVLFENPSWIKNTLYTFEKKENEQLSEWLDFEYDFEYDFAGDTSNMELVNSNFEDSCFIFRIYGACVNPKIFIDSHEYSVSCVVNTGEYLTIDSMSKEVYVTKINGEKVNVYSKRGTIDYIYEKIRPGTHSVSTSTDFSFEICIIEERSEPIWI
ncbi:hypothetical protein ACTQ6A_13975 [Lachnospiraceae bacterium LCP25S3_G4]